MAYIEIQNPLVLHATIMIEERGKGMNHREVFDHQFAVSRD